MALLDEVKTEEKVAKKSNDYQKKMREKTRHSAQLLGAVIKKANLKLTPEEQEALDFLTRAPKAANTNFGTPVINKLFGDELKVGAKKTALEVFESTGKGFSEMRQLMKKWEKAGTIVTYDEKAKAYVITKIGA